MLGMCYIREPLGLTRKYLACNEHQFNPEYMHDFQNTARSDSQILSQQLSVASNKAHTHLHTCIKTKEKNNPLLLLVGFPLVQTLWETVGKLLKMNTTFI